MDRMQLTDLVLDAAEHWLERTYGQSLSPVEQISARSRYIINLLLDVQEFYKDAGNFIERRLQEEMQK